MHYFVFFHLYFYRETILWRKLGCNSTEAINLHEPGTSGINMKTICFVVHQNPHDMFFMYLKRLSIKTFMLFLAVNRKEYTLKYLSALQRSKIWYMTGQAQYSCSCYRICQFGAHRLCQGHLCLRRVFSLITKILQNHLILYCPYY